MNNKLYLAVIGIILVIAVFAGANYLTHSVAQPAFCNNCHEIRNEYLVWTVSSHSQVDCRQCHSEQEFKSRARQILKQLTHVYLHFVRAEGKETGFEAEIPDARCQQCHTSERAVSPGGDVKIPHLEHIVNPAVQCVDCHRNVTHGGENAAKIIAQIEQNRDVTQLKSQLTSQMQRRDLIPSMGLCLQCHDGVRAPNACQACHQEIAVPENHQEGGWRNSGHGKRARQAVAQCLECHSLMAGSNRSASLAEMSIYQVVESNQFCKNCHMLRPASHQQDWIFQHRVSAAQDAGRCTACHPEEKQKAGLATSCATCHQDGHAPNWLRGHPRIVREQGTKDCNSCHGANNCADCHTGRAAQLLRRLD